MPVFLVGDDIVWDVVKADDEKHAIFAAVKIAGYSSSQDAAEACGLSEDVFLDRQRILLCDKGMSSGYEACFWLPDIEIEQVILSGQFVYLAEKLPETVKAGVVGKRLSALVSHPVFDEYNLAQAIILSADDGEDDSPGEAKTRLIVDRIPLVYDAAGEPSYPSYPTQTRQ